MSFLAKHKKGLIILSVIVLALGIGCARIYGYMIKPLIQAQREYIANALETPYFDLRDIETDYRLVPISSDLYNDESFKFDDSWPHNNPTVYRQDYDGYLSENNQNSTRITLTCRYWFITEIITLADMMDNDTPLQFIMEKGKTIKDSRFDICRTGGIRDLFSFSNEEKSFSVVVRRGQHLMMIDYSGGRLAINDFLDKLDEIL
jgi:hypothetical protein